MISLLIFVGNCLITTVCTIIVLIAMWLILLYSVGASVLTFTAVKYKFKNPLRWLNPRNLIEYSGVKTTIYMGSGDLIIDYFGNFPKVKFIKERETQ